jgi:hypothetical protein
MTCLHKETVNATYRPEIFKFWWANPLENALGFFIINLFSIWLYVAE